MHVVDPSHHRGLQHESTAKGLHLLVRRVIAQHARKEAKAQICKLEPNKARLHRMHPSSILLQGAFTTHERWPCQKSHLYVSPVDKRLGFQISPSTHVFIEPRCLLFWLCSFLATMRQ